MALDPTLYPYDTVVRITDTIGGVSYQGSGVLIAPDEVLTASHVVYLSGVGTASNIVVTPGSGIGSTPFGSAQGASFHYYAINDTNGLISNFDSQSDFAVIHLSTSFTSTGYMGLLPDFSGGAVTIAGYPGSANGTMVSSFQTVRRDPRFTLLDGVSLGKGSSGGPLFVTGAAGPQVVGTVSSEGIGTTAGYNALITTAAFNQIEQWIAADQSQTTTQAPIIPQDGTTTVSGTHTQYIIANSSGNLYYQDRVANRNGAQDKPGVDEIIFSDGVGRFDATGNAEEVARLYGVALGRAPDLAGLNDWTHQIDANTLQLSNVALGFVNSTEFQARYGSFNNQDFVQALYQNALGRPGEATGIAAWTTQLDAGVSRATIVVEFSDSFEHKQNSLSNIGDKDLAEVYRLYQAAFNRTPDQVGLQFWTGVLDSGTSPLAVAQDMTGTSEFASMFAGLDATAEVNKLCSNGLHRTGDPSEIAYWAGQIQSGTSMGQVLLAFADTLENRMATAGATHDAWVYTTT